MIKLSDLNLKLGTQLNISFALVLFIPMIIATAFSSMYYSKKMQEDTIHQLSSHLQVADIIYQNSLIEMQYLAKAYAQKKLISVLTGYNLGEFGGVVAEKIGRDLAESARSDNLDMITLVDISNKVLVRSHAPTLINDYFPKKEFTAEALSGESQAGTEALNAHDLDQEGFKYRISSGAYNEKILVLTGVAPVYDSRYKNIIGAIVVRRIIDENTSIIKGINQNIHMHASLFAGTRLIASGSTNSPKRAFSALPETVLQKVIDQNTAVENMDFRTGGSISKCLPIQDFSGKAVGALMIQTGVETYFKTRNTAISTLLLIFLVGIVLAMIVKTIIVRRILNPIQHLKDGTERISMYRSQNKRKTAEYCNPELEITSRDEIGELTQAFNTMARDLARYDRQLEDRVAEVDELNKNLEQKVMNRTRELDASLKLVMEAKKAAETSNEAKNTFIANMSHEFRTPLHAILSFSRFGITRIKESDKLKLLYYFNQINTAGNRLMPFINDILNLSKLESGMLEYHKKRHCLFSIAADAKADFFTLAQSKALSLKVKQLTAKTVAFCDKDKINQVIRNLINNAINYSKANGEIIIIISKASTIPNDETDSDRMMGLTLSVSDQGIGIPENELELIFDSFTQSSKTKTGAGGTGLGLSICKRIIDDHQGRIWAENNNQGGAIFSFTLPISTDHQQQKAASKNQDTHPAAPDSV